MKHTEDLRQLVLSYFPGQALPGDVVEGVIKYDVTSLCLPYSHAGSYGPLSCTGVDLLVSLLQGFTVK